MSEFIVEAKGVTKVLGHGAAQVYALKDISLSLRRGELTVLMGPSGSGKTTLLSVLGCMLTPTSGAVRVCGYATEGADAKVLAKLRKDHVGFVFQSYHLFPTLTAAENIQLALDIRGMHGEDARAKSLDVLKKVGLAHKSTSYPRELSGGEQQRVAIARAIAGDPAFLLADEPTGNLHSAQGEEIMELFKRLNDAGTTIIQVTHSEKNAAYGHRIIQLKDGWVVGSETTAAARPA